MRLKALAEIYTMHSSAQLCNLKSLSKLCQTFCKILRIIAHTYTPASDTQLSLPRTPGAQVGRKSASVSRDVGKGIGGRARRTKEEIFNDIMEQNLLMGVKQK